MLLCLASLSATIFPEFAQTQTENGTLIEEFYVVIPDTFAPTGLELSSEGAILAWSKETGKVFHFTDGRNQRQLTLPSGSQPIGGAILNDGSLELFEANQGSIYRFSKMGVSLGVQQTKLKGAVAATKVASSWYFLQRRAADSIALMSYDSTGKIELLHFEQLVNGESINLTRGKGGRDLLLANSRAPFFIKRISIDSGVVQTFKPKMPQSTIWADTWRALPVISMKFGYIQTIADLRSDGRYIILYSHDGSTRTVRYLNVPIGIGAGSPSTSEVAAVRNLHLPEIVRFKWRAASKR